MADKPRRKKALPPPRPRPKASCGARKRFPADGPLRAYTAICSLVKDHEVSPSYNPLEHYSHKHRIAWRDSDG